MKKKILVLGLLILFTVLFAEKAVIRIANPSQKIVDEYQKSADVAAYVNGQYIDIVLPINEAKKLANSSSNITITQTETQLKSNLGSRDLPGYRNYDELLSELQNLETTYPEICKLYDIGESRGKEYSENGNSYYDDFHHEVWALKISDNVNEEEDEPSIYFMGEHHAREPISLEVVMYATNHILENYGIDTEITENVDNTELWVVPLVNPNGHKIVTDQTDVWWRKNICDNNENGIFDTDNSGGSGDDGVDPNRNYGFAWGFVGASGNPNSSTYHGQYEFSEPEIFAMKELLSNHHFVAGTSYHSYSELVLFPFGYESNIIAPDHDALEQLAIDMAITIPKQNGGTYTPTESWMLYPAMGTTDDYAYGQHGIFAYTIELGTEFIPPANEVESMCEDNLEAALIMFDRASHDMVTGIITDSETGETIVAELFIEGLDDSDVFREPYKSSEEFGRYYRLLETGAYDITFSAFGYETYTAENVQVSTAAPTELNIQLTPAISDINITGIVWETGFDSVIPNAVIEFLDSDLPNVTTNENGQFYVDNLFEFNYNILVYAENCEARYYTLEVTAQETFFDLDLASLNDGTFENNMSGFYWDYEGNGDWYTTSNGYSSNYSFRSGNIGHSESTSASFTLNVLEDDEISFMKKVSTEANYDYFRFYIDGIMQDEWAGDLDWNQETFSINAGIHTFKWEYIKDQGITNYDDCVYIDNIEFPATFGVFADDNYSIAKPISEFRNYPNPFNPSAAGRCPTTTISFTINKNIANGELAIFNIKGQKISTLFKNSLQSGTHSFVWNGKDDNNKNVASGIYFYKLSTDESSYSNKMILIK